MEKNYCEGPNRTEETSASPDYRPDNPHEPLVLKCFFGKNVLGEILLRSAIWGAIISPFVSFILGGGLENPMRVLTQWAQHWVMMIWLLPVVGWIWGLVLSSSGVLFRYSLIPRLYKWRSKLHPGVAVTASAFAVGFLAMLVIYYFLLYVFTVRTFGPGGPLSEAGLAGLISIGVGQILYSHFLKEVHLWETWKREQVLAKHKLEGELMNLNMRIRPHFFFNAINTLASLIDQDTERAQDFLADLADLFRKSFNHGQNTPWCTWREERELVQAYLQIEMSRFGDRLRFQWDDELPPDMQFPAFLVQPLVENAVKYGLRTNNEQVVIAIRADSEGKDWMIQVSNPSDSSVLPTITPGHSLESISKRMKLLSGELELTSDNGAVTVSLKAGMTN